MMKKIVAITTAAAAITSLFATSVFAADAEPLPWNTNGGSMEMEGDAYTVDPVIEVELPGDLAFGINPLQLDADEDGNADAQIVSGQYPVINYSNVPVLVEASTTLEAGDKVAILADADYETNGDLKATDGKKAIWMAQLYPTSAATIGTEGEITLKTTDIAASNKNADIKGKPLGSTAAEVKFMLAAYKDADGLKPAGVSGFKFGGAVDPNATFDAETDAIKVKTTFTLNTLSQNQVANDYETLDTGYDTTVVKDKVTAGP